MADLEVNYELAAGVGELGKAYDFLMDIAKLGARAMYRAVQNRDPAFIQHCACMDEPPASAYDFWKGFGSWTITSLSFKYRQSWDEVLDAYFKSPLHLSKVQKAAMWADVEEVVKESGF